MEPITQALAAAALARTGLNRLGREAIWILLVAGVAPDLDLLSYFGGALTYFRYHRTLLHSFMGAAILAFIIAALATWIARRSNAERTLPFLHAFGLSLLGSALHLGLDLCDSRGVQILWPLRSRWFAWNFSPKLDLIAAGMLLLALLVPELLSMVSEEIGERKRTPPGQQRWAIAALAVLTLYMAGRAALHYRAAGLLMSRSYRGATPIRADAFPTLWPAQWRGIIATDNALIEIDVPMDSSAEFDPERGVAHIKPDESPALAVAQRSEFARRYLRYARFPLAQIEPNDNGARFVLRDLRFAADDNDRDNLLVVIDIDSNNRVASENLRYASDEPRRLRR